jgi:hypothetical protein
LAGELISELAGRGLAGAIVTGAAAGFAIGLALWTPALGPAKSRPTTSGQ